MRVVCRVLSEENLPLVSRYIQAHWWWPQSVTSRSGSHVEMKKDTKCL